MLVVKITILLIVVTAIFRFFVVSYLKQNPDETLKMVLYKNHARWYIWFMGILVILSMIGVILSTTYLLFFR